MVTFTYNDGRKLDMIEHHAKILKMLGHGSYMTRDLVAQRTNNLPERKKLSLTK